MDRRLVFIGILLLVCPDHYSGSAHRLSAEHPAPKQGAGIVLPALKRDSLLNGLQIVLHEQKKPTISLMLRINSGAVFDLAGKGGLAELTASLLLRGGGGLAPRDVADFLEQSGISIHSSVDWDSTELSLSGPGGSLEDMLDLLGRLVGSPNFDQKEFDELKAERLADLKSVSQNDARVVSHKAAELLFGSHPYGRPEKGSADSVAKITREDVNYFYRRFYLANNSTLVVSGEVKAEEAIRLARTKLGSWKKGDIVPATFRPPELRSARSIVIVDRTGTDRAHASISQMAISRKDQDYFSVLILSEVFSTLVKKALPAGSKGEVRFEPRILPGTLSVDIESEPGYIGQYIDSVLSMMTGLQSSLPTLDQVESAKSKSIAAFAERLQTTDGVAQIVLDIETYRLGRDYMITLTDRINSVTPADVHRAAQNNLRPHSVVVAIAAPASCCEDALKKLGSVTVLK